MNLMGHGSEADSSDCPIAPDARSARMLTVADSVVVRFTAPHSEVMVSACEGATLRFGRGGDCDLRFGFAPTLDRSVPRLAGQIRVLAGGPGSKASPSRVTAFCRSRSPKVRWRAWHTVRGDAQPNLSSGYSCQATRSSIGSQ